MCVDFVVQSVITISQNRDKLGQSSQILNRPTNLYRQLTFARLRLLAVQRHVDSFRYGPEGSSCVVDPPRSEQRGRNARDRLDLIGEPRGLTPIPRYRGPSSGWRKTTAVKRATKTT